MAEHHRKSIYRAVSNALYNNTDAGANVYVDYVPENRSRPYLLIRMQSDNERNFHTRQFDPAVVLLVKAVSTDLEQALDIIQQAKEMLDDQGEQDLSGLDGGADWYLLKATVLESMSMSYMTGTTRLYEEGFQIRIVMQEV